MLGALTVVLHVLVFQWFNGQLGHAPDAVGHAAPAPMEAELVPEASMEPAKQPPLVVPPDVAVDEPPLPKVEPEPVQPEPPASPAADPGSPADAAAQEAGLAAGTGPGAPATQETPASGAGDVQSQQPGPPAATAQADPAPQPQPSQQPAQPAPPPAPASTRSLHYKTDLPPSSAITLAVTRTDADGTRWNGEQSLSWTVSPSGYRIQVDASLKVMFAHVNLLTLTSEGTVGADGFIPILMTEKRRGKSMTATHFNHKDGTLTFSASQSKYPLEVGAQDKASIPLQLTAIARGDPKQMAGTLEILVGEEREAAIYTFTVAGQEQIDTPLGRIDTVHVVRPPKAGAYHARLDLWLAPAYGWYPVQIRSVEQNGAVTTQTAAKIEIKHPGS